jgi:glycosyltransferase involved in cell wall biosynthesis
MKIAIVYDMIYPFSVGGAEVRNYEIAKRLAKKHEVHLFGVKLWKGKDIIERGGVRIHGICRYRQKYTFGGKRLIIEPMIFSYKLLKSLLKEKFDVVDSTSFPYFHCFTCKLYSLARNVPLVISWHEVWKDYWYEYLGKKGFFGKVVEKMVSKLTKNVVAVSSRTRKKLIELGVNKRMIKSVYNGVDLNVINSVKKSSERSDIIYVGRLMEHKGIDKLIRAISVVKKKKPEVKAIIIGEGPEKRKLIKLSKSMGLEENIKFIDFLPEREDVYSYMKSSKIFALPSILEGFSIVTIEANACKTPVLTVRHENNATTDLIVNGKNGIVVENDYEEIAKGLSKLLNNRRLLERMGRESYEFVKENFDWERSAKGMEILYENLMG